MTIYWLGGQSPSFPTFIASFPHVIHVRACSGSIHVHLPPSIWRYLLANVTATGLSSRDFASRLLEDEPAAGVAGRVRSTFLGPPVGSTGPKVCSNLKSVGIDGIGMAQIGRVRIYLL